MNTQEREQLTRFLQQLAQAQAGTKDVEADRLIRETCERHPDASYLLVLRALLLEQALSTAQAEVARLENELANTRRGSGGFLDSNAWGNTPNQARSAPAAPGFASAAVPAAQSFQGTTGPGMGLLGTIATTAAGVVAGSFLYQGIESLMGHHERSNGLLSENTPKPSPLAATETPASSVADDNPAPLVDLDSLGPDDDDAGWA